MSDTAPDAVGGSRLTRAFKNMPKWKAGLLVVSLVVGVLGTGAYVAARNVNRPQTVTVTAPAHPGDGVSSTGGSGFVGGGNPVAADQPQTVTTTTQATPSLTEQYTPLVAKVGFSFFVGLISGTISRVFLKFAALLAALVVGGIAAAHHFNINVDLAGVQAQTGEATSWLHGQLDQLWASTKNHLPSAGSATAGFLFGLKRR